jgi:hypothetical protein
VDNAIMDHGSYVRCRIRDDQLFLTVASGTAPIEELACPLGDVREVLDSGRLDGTRLEEVIARIEDRIMPILGRLPAQSRLQVLGSRMNMIFALLPDTAATDVPVATVEHLFNDLADCAMGSTTTWRHACRFEDVAFALVVLRELMQHAGFDTCEWPEQAPEPDGSTEY